MFYWRGGPSSYATGLGITEMHKAQKVIVCGNIVDSDSIQAMNSSKDEHKARD